MFTYTIGYSSTSKWDISPTVAQNVDEIATFIHKRLLWHVTSSFTTMFVYFPHQQAHE